MISKPTVILRQGPNERWIQPVNAAIAATGLLGGTLAEGRHTAFSESEDSTEAWAAAHEPQLLFVSDLGDLPKTARWVAELRHECPNLRTALVCYGTPPKSLPRAFDYVVDPSLPPERQNSPAGVLSDFLRGCPTP